MLRLMGKFPYPSCFEISAQIKVLLFLQLVTLTGTNSGYFLFYFIIDLLPKLLSNFDFLLILGLLDKFEKLLQVLVSLVT